MDSDPPTDDTDTDDTLRERVADLEATVAAQQQTIAKLLPGRRGVLKAGALVGGGGLLGALTADRASADASGQVGTTSDPIDVVAYSLQDRTGENAFLQVVASGSVTLSSGSATVTANASHSAGSTYYLALGTTENAKISGRVFNDGSLKVELVESGTSVGNPTVEYAVLQVS
jgi:hypothetical protein